MTLMNAEPTPATGKRWTASELRKLPAAQRDAILAAAAALAGAEYRNDPALTALMPSARMICMAIVPPPKRR
jgi:hypothetical protein